MRKTPLARLFGRIATGLLIAGLPALATAQLVPAAQPANYSFSKTTAILGGSSALAEILAAQGAVSVRTTALLRSSSAAATRVAPAALPSEQVGATVSNTSWRDRPDVFGSIALPISHTSLDGRWKSVEYAPVTGSAASFARSLRSLDPVERAQRVNAYVNDHVAFADDYRRFHRADVWSSADDTLRSGRGDCEDYAIAKRAMLREAGISERDLYLVLVRDLVRRADHAVLVVHAEGRTLLLDNGTDQLLDPSSVQDYRPVLTFASNREWTHGYVRQEPRVEIAQADLQRALIPAADQRSLNASLLAFNTGLSR